MKAVSLLKGVYTTTIVRVLQATTFLRESENEVQADIDSANTARDTIKYKVKSRRSGSFESTGVHTETADQSNSNY
jgi:hypothetical protein